MVFKFVIDNVAGRVPVLAGTGSNNTAEAIELSQAAQEAGADAVLVGESLVKQSNLEQAVQYLLHPRQETLV